jgi:hypothetical protein
VTFQSFDYLSLLCTPGCYYLVTYNISLIYSHIDLINFHCFTDSHATLFCLFTTIFHLFHKPHSFIHATESFTIHTDNKLSLFYSHATFFLFIYNHLSPISQTAFTPFMQLNLSLFIPTINFHCFIHTLLFFIYSYMLQPSFTYITNRIHSFMQLNLSLFIPTD